ARRAVRHPAALGAGVAGPGGTDLSHRGGRGAAGGGPQRLESRQPARALLGVALAPAPSGAREHLRPAVVVPALPAPAADDHRRARRAGRALGVPARRYVQAGVGSRRGRRARHLPPARHRDLAAGVRAARGLDVAGAVGLSRRPRTEESMSLVTIPARRGRAARVRAGQRIRVVNTHGTQVVDAWAFDAQDSTEWMAMEASRAWFMKLAAAVGDSFVTNRRRPILTLVEDTSGCAHDTLMAPCDADRYGLLGVKGHHDNCRDN